MSRPIVALATWSFGQRAVEAAGQVLLRSPSNGLEAVEAGISVVELDPSVDSVGFGGSPNEAGVMQLDACIMDGPHHEVGSVMAVEGVVPVISLARAVLQESRHCVLAGEGARQFALKHGWSGTQVVLSPEAKLRYDITWLEQKTKLKRRRVMGLKELRTHPALNSWEAEMRKPAAERQRREIKNIPIAASKSGPSHNGHDTVGLVVLDGDGNLWGGCATSGLSFKEPGRVGDSAIIGSGLFVDNDVGAATATGVGEVILKNCLSFLTVELMRQGHSPQQACEMALRRTLSKTKDPTLAAAVIALNKQGQTGGAGTIGDPLTYATWRRESDGRTSTELFHPPPFTP